ncbi:MAG: redox-regulated ATPase YchF [Candidatus Sungbacteria bacterium]|uniref:Ribosome-binding ATPase YchF n=1 Tax=Candidatus Sungiibacteriota bacterium TaxID=2750080 RepID=A0A9D6HQT9_9BACT|nr:redox-regulated ATPase YchF [Candidatus Sungbacteria bacterium]
MKIGIVGLPNVGKSTLFKSLTQKEVVIANYPFATIDPNIGVVAVPDERLHKLASFSDSKKTVSAIIEFVDIAGLVKGAAQGLGLGNEFLSNIRDVDAVLHLVRVFKDANIIHVENEPNPLRDFEIINLELILKDLDITSKALVKAESDAKSGDKLKIKRREALQKIKKLLEENKLLHGQLDSDEIKIAYEIGLLTYKPMLVVFNISESELSQNWQPDENLKKAIGDIPYLAIPIGLETMAADATELEKKELLEMVGIKETGLIRLIKKGYETLGLMTFFTTGQDESRAWTVPAGSTAPRAGRAIHSDFEEKFIRAEVIHWDKLLEAESWSKARDLGWLRVEGKEYIVGDGDVMEFRI